MKIIELNIFYQAVWTQSSIFTSRGKQEAALEKHAHHELAISCIVCRAMPRPTNLYPSLLLLNRNHHRLLSHSYLSIRASVVRNTGASPRIADYCRRVVCFQWQIAAWYS